MTLDTIPAVRYEVTFRGTFDAVRDWQRQSFATGEEAQAFAEGLAYGDEPAYDVLNVTTDDTPRCDLCGHAMECDREDTEGDHGPEWNGETGNHVSCEADEADPGWSNRPISYGEIAAINPAYCMSSPDGKGPHRPDDTTDPVTCAECGQDLSDLNMEEPTDA